MAKGQKDTYKLEKTLEFPNMVVRVFRPELTDDERKKRLKNIHNAAACLLQDLERKRGNETVF